MQSSQPLVAIRCLAYNHAKYIEQTLNGFVMQQTNFRYVAIVHDDCSTDHTAELISQFARRYPDIVSPIYEKENLYSKPGRPLRKIMNDACSSYKYTAFCEGDDYWIDPLKLQKQVDYLEQHPDVDLVCGKVRVYNENNRTFMEERGSADCEKYETIVVGYNDINTPTVMVRTQKLLECYADLYTFMPNELCIDTAIWYWFARNSKIKYFDEAWSVYRVLPESASHTQDAQHLLEKDLKFLKLKLYFLSHYPLQKVIETSMVIDALLEEIQVIGQQYAYIKENQIRSSKTYQTGKKIANIFKKLGII